MKKTFKLFSVLFALVLFTNVSFSQIPQYTLEVKNSDILDPNTMVFDLIFTHTNADLYEVAGWQFFFWVPATLGTFPVGFGGNSAFVYDSTGGDAVSDLPTGFRPRNPNAVASSSNSVPGYEMRLAANSLPGAGNGIIIAQGVPTLIGRYIMKSTSPIDLNALITNPFIIRDSCETPLSLTRTKINSYIITTNTEITRCANHSVADGGALPVELASFTSAVNRNNVTLNWSTAKEINNSGFDIERSKVGTSVWTKAGNITGNGTTNDTKSYAFTERVETGSY
ncbi:MAG: hypothetical protein WAT71_06790, partial [Ignavibacteria bacterium]